MTVCEPRGTRASDGDRDAALAALRDAYAVGKITENTLVLRLDAALSARTRRDLSELLADLAEPAGPTTRPVFTFVGRVSRIVQSVRLAWHAPLLPALALPQGPDDRTIGRAPGCDFVVSDMTVSKSHAALLYGSDGWYLCDLGSTNGTYLNGWRVRRPVLVRVGDVLTLGTISFQIASGSK